VGLPGISLPADLSRAGLPIGLELDAPLGSDRELLNLARGIEDILSAKSSAS
jgi:Asp-tRNA(Asn)/Glu-tRNA(Gln) amidotransferase A subunit family amidase